MIHSKWYIKRTADNYLEVNEWFNKTLGRNHKSGIGILYYPEFHGAKASDAIEQGFVEITTGFFRKHIAHSEPVEVNTYEIY